MTGSGRPGPAGRIERAFETLPPRWRMPARAAASLGIGLLVGLAFTLPVLGYLQTLPGQRRTLVLLVAAAFAILIVRRAGRLLRAVLDATPQPWRLPLLGLYGLAAMSLPAALLLGQPNRATPPDIQASRPGR